MAVFKCKMCGGALELSGNETVVTCDYCDSVQTVSKKNDDVIANLFNRANNLRIKGEFDKAAEVYERIINEDNTDAEAYWGLVLCKYGIEYVEDPKTFKRIPTCHRTQYESILTDVDYKAAISNADSVSQGVYKTQAEEIANLQKDILAIVKNEKPFDVFICYKETDENGRRTVDSALANDIYYQLTQEGFKVFYAAITLEDKLGVEYEPYIFAALNSAKVMLVVGTKPEHFEAVWVKNEWSRYLKIIKTDRSKILIPCYRDMDAYDLPDEFSHLQAQDMSKIGFVNDVVRGIRKIITPDVPKAEKETVIVNQSTTGNAGALIKRAFMALEDGDFVRADDFCEQVLNIDAENAEAYLGKLMAEQKVRIRSNLANCGLPFDNSSNYQKAVRFGNEALVSELEGYIKYINERNENNRLKSIYNKAFSAMSSSRTEDKFKQTAYIFKSISGYKDSDKLAEYCLAKAEEKRIEAERNREIAKKKVKKIIPIIVAAFTVLIGVVILAVNVIIPASRYNSALKLAEKGDYVSAAIAFANLDDYKDAKEKSFELWDKIAVRETISAGSDHTVGLKSDGTVVAVGYNGNGQCDVSDWKDIVAVSAGDGHTVGLKNNGTVVAVGYIFYGQCDVSDWKDIGAVSAGDGHTVGLKSDGTVVAVGKNDSGQCDVSGWMDIVAVSAGYFHTIGLKSDGTVVAVGKNDSGQCDVSGWMDIVAVSAGSYHTVGLKSDGTVVAVGDNYYGQCDVSDWKDIVAVSAGLDQTVGLKSDGTVVAVGSNGYGQCDVSDWKDIVAVYAGDGHTVGLKSDGTVVAVGNNYYGQRDVSDWKDIKQLNK